MKSNLTEAIDSKSSRDTCINILSSYTKLCAQIQTYQQSLFQFQRRENDHKTEILKENPPKKNWKTITEYKRCCIWVPMRLAKVMLSLGLRIGMTDSLSNLMISFFFPLIMLWKAIQAANPISQKYKTLSHCNWKQKLRKIPGVN